MNLATVSLHHHRRVLASCVMHGLKIAEQVQPFRDRVRLQIDKRSTKDAKRVASGPLQLCIDQGKCGALRFGLKLPHLHGDVDRIDRRQNGVCILFPRLRRRQLDPKQRTQLLFGLVPRVQRLRDESTSKRLGGAHGQVDSCLGQHHALLKIVCRQNRLDKCRNRTVHQRDE